MSKEDIIIAVYKNNDNSLLSSFAQGLINGFNNCKVNAYTYDYCLANNLKINMAIGFDTTGIEYWQKNLSNNITNVVWSTDSIFKSNIDAISQFSSFEKFVVFESTPADINAVNKFLPQLKHGYIPHAIDTEITSTLNKEIDIVYVSKIEDYEVIEKTLKDTYPETVYNLIIQIKDIILQSPNITFWQINTLINDNLGITLDKDQYTMLFQNACTLADNERKVKMVQALSDYNVKIYGNDTWKKFVKGKIEYCGECNNFDEYTNILSKSKISLYLHPFSLGLGIHENILHSTIAGALSLCGESPSIKAEFSDSLAYFNNTTLENIASQVQYYLSNEEERINNINKAYEIVKSKHTWTNRAQSILEIIE